MGRGQAYDGASNMCSGNVGIGTRNTEVNQKSPYFYCISHRLNLAIGGACKLLTIISLSTPHLKEKLFSSTSVSNKPILVVARYCLACANLTGVNVTAYEHFSW